ncbi:MAG: S-layer homology domain-containing protein [Treponemataceae bacterium]|nr:S-layer homology domain-containing protein [Treponemataceae bacterium]
MMKRIAKVNYSLFFISIFALCLFSCTTLQEDIYYSTIESDFTNLSVSEYENQYVKIDVDLNLGNEVSPAQISMLLEILDRERNSAYLEPAVRARICALEGNLLCLTGKKSNAAELFKLAKNLQSSDPYVQVLNAKLGRNAEEQLEKLDAILQRDEKHPLAELEKAKIYYEQKEFDQAVASIDKALIILKAKGKDYYVEQYTLLKNAIWNDSQRNGYAQVKNQNLTPARIIELTQSNSDILTFFTGGKKIRTAELMKALEKGGYFSAATDPDNENKTSQEFVKAQSLDRRLSARFLWNLYVQNSQKQSSKTKYSSVFAANPKLKSPIADVESSNPDFDAIMGCVEKEIINLSDGRNFYPDKVVTEPEFVDFLLHLRR